jgi:hypothetical protein
MANSGDPVMGTVERIELFSNREETTAPRFFGAENAHGRFMRYRSRIFNSICENVKHYCTT